MGKVPRIANELADLEHVPVNELAPFQGELKELSTREYKKLKKSLTENGIIVPFFVWPHDGALWLLDGHQRHRVFNNEAWNIDVPVIRIHADNEQDAKQKVLVISSQYGKITQEGYDEFTFDMDDNWLQETVMFDALPFVFGDTSPPEEEESKDADPQTSRADELRETWGVELGQMWRLPSRVEGQEHRLICGDCTDGDVVERVMGGEVAGLLLADPPYGINWDGNYTRFTKNGVAESRTNYDGIEGDAKKFDPLMWIEFKNVVLWGANFYYHKLPIGTWLVWDKRSADGTAFLADAEIAWKRGGRGVYIKSINQQSEKSLNRDIYHPTKKPVGLFEWCIKGVDSVLIVLDPFSGSGTTIIAAENLSRQCRSVEISPAYCAVALDRYERAFGIKPELITG